MKTNTEQEINHKLVEYYGGETCGRTYHGLCAPHGDLVHPLHISDVEMESNKVKENALFKAM